MSMEAENFGKTLRTFQSRVPYRPFTVILTTGDQFEVDHAGAFVYRDGVGIYVAPGGTPVIFDHPGVSHFVGDLKSQKSSTEP